MLATIRIPMTKLKGQKKNTLCTHAGEIHDAQFKGAISPLYMSTSYAFTEVEMKRYPRYFNTPNQQQLAVKIAALEHAESALVFGSGMAAVSTSLLAFLQKGDHVIFQKSLYGGTFNLVQEVFEKFGIEYSFTEDLSEKGFRNKLKLNTKVIYIETPSNPLLAITELKGVAKIAKENGLITMIDNTFASPVNQNPILFGIDIVIHSATKYLGGHSDILAGAVAASNEHIEKIFKLGINFGGNLSDYTVWLLDRSIKTLVLRVKQQNRNAKHLAKFLSKHQAVKKVYYPGLKSHPSHQIAKEQMYGYGGMISFELNDQYDAKAFMHNLELIKPSMSLAGVESTILLPALTSHALLSEKEREQQGITHQLLRFSVGIEDKQDLMDDINQALLKTLPI